MILFGAGAFSEPGSRDPIPLWDSDFWALADCLEVEQVIIDTIDEIQHNVTVSGIPIVALQPTDFAIQVVMHGIKDGIRILSEFHPSSGLLAFKLTCLH